MIATFWTGTRNGSRKICVTLLINWLYLNDLDRNGTYADYFVTAVVTGEVWSVCLSFVCNTIYGFGDRRGQGGLSFVLVEVSCVRNQSFRSFISAPWQAGLEGFSRRKVNIPQSTISGTAYLDFNNCRVPKSELIGKENKGFKLIMWVERWFGKLMWKMPWFTMLLLSRYNFNHVRGALLGFLHLSCASLSRVNLNICLFISNLAPLSLEWLSWRFLFRSIHTLSDLRSIISLNPLEN